MLGALVKAGEDIFFFSSGGQKYQGNMGYAFVFPEQ